MLTYVIVGLCRVVDIRESDEIFLRRVSHLVPVCTVTDLLRKGWRLKLLQLFIWLIVVHFCSRLFSNMAALQCTLLKLQLIVTLLCY